MAIKKEKPNSLFDEFNRLEGIIIDNEASEYNRNMSKRDDYYRTQRYLTAYRKLNQLKQSNPHKYEEYQIYKHKKEKQREEKWKKDSEIRQLLAEQELAKKKNAVLREVGLVHYGLTYDNYEQEQQLNEKQGKKWLALYEWVESKGFNLCLDKNGQNICKK